MVGALISWEKKIVRFTAVCCGGSCWDFFLGWMGGVRYSTTPAGKSNSGVTLSCRYLISGVAVFQVGYSPRGVFGSV